jgi:hypothetical protein
MGDKYYGSGGGHVDGGKQDRVVQAGAYPKASPRVSAKTTLDGGLKKLTTTPFPAGGGIRELPRKCMADLPHRIVIELVNRGWVHRHTVIWHKPNALPESVNDRPTIDYEFLFMLTKKPRYYYEQQFEPIKTVTMERAKGFRSSTDRSRGMPPVGGHKYTSKAAEIPNPQKFSGRRVSMRGQRNLRSVWMIPVTQYKDAHFAVFPTELIKKPIMASCPKEVCQTCGEARKPVFQRQSLERYQLPVDDPRYRPDSYRKKYVNAPQRYNISQVIGHTNCECADYRRGIVLDPFIGSGTTALVARALGRDWVGIELSEEYVRQTYRRLGMGE